MDVRDARPADAPRIAAVARASWHAAYGDFLPEDAIDATVDEWYDPAGIRERIREEGTVVLVAVGTDGGGGRALNPDDGDPVAFAQARDSESVGNVVLDRLYALPAYWGSGVGSAMLKTVARRFAGEHDRLSAVVLADNDVGRAFYDARGFSVVDEQTTTFGGEERRELIVAAPLADLAEPDGECPGNE